MEWQRLWREVVAVVVVAVVPGVDATAIEVVVESAG